MDQGKVQPRATDTTRTAASLLGTAATPQHEISAAYVAVIIITIFTFISFLFTLGT